MGLRHADQMALNSPTSGGRSFCKVRSWTRAREFSFSFINKCRGGMCALALTSYGLYECITVE
jgi:hypothetical protein